MNWKFWQGANAGATMEASQGDPADVNSGVQERNFTFSDISIGQLLDALNGSGDDGLSVIYKPRFYNRNSAICLVALNRAVSLLASVGAHLFSNGYYRIVDRGGKRLNSPKAEALRELLSHSLDGYECSAYNIKDAIADLLLEGNFLFWADKDSNGVVQRLVRLVPWSAQTYNKTTDGFEYHAEVAHMRGYKGSYVTLPNTEVIHGRMTQLSRVHGSNGSRQLFSRAPVVTMRPTLEAGLALDDYVRNFAHKGHIQNLAVNFKEGDQANELTPEQKKEISDYILTQQRKRQGFFVLEDGSATELTPKIDPNLAQLREWQVQDVARFYGIPGPILALNLTSWGSGIAELGRMFVSYSVSQHLRDFADAIAFRCLEPGARLELNYQKLLPTDAKAKKDLLDALRGDGQRIGIATLQECRDAADLERDYEGELVNQKPAGVKDDNNSDREESEDSDKEDLSSTAQADEDTQAEINSWLTN